jgi:hypothetical protein
MAYFSNGTEGMSYQEEYCDKCIFDKDQKCPIWFLHLRDNYELCNDPSSYLNHLIPRRKAPDFGNEECFFYMPAPSIGLDLSDGTEHG